MNNINNDITFIRNMPRSILDEWDNTVSHIKKFMDKNNGRIKGGKRNEEYQSGKKINK